MGGMLKRVATVLTIKSKVGVTAVEYGLIVGLLAVAIVSAIALLGSNAPVMLNDAGGPTLSSGT